jgi:ABC-type bacteriocin/lantibiotic exporter with double-glycine peptidase domain
MRPMRRWRSGPSLYSLIMGQTARLQAAAVALGLLLPPLAVVPLEMQQRIIDEAIPAGDIRAVANFAAVLAGAVIAAAILRGAVHYLQGWIVEIVTRILRISIISAQRKRSAAHARSELGAVTSVMAAEVEPLGDFAAEAINTPLIQGGTLASVFGYMFVTEPRLAAIGAVALIAEAGVTPILQYRINLLTAERIVRLRRAGLDLILSTEPGEHGALVPGLGEIRASYRLRLQMNALKAALKVARHVIERAATVATLAFGAVMVVNGETELGVVVAFLSGLRQVQGPWGELLDFYRRLADARVKYRLVRGAITDIGPGPSVPGVAEARRVAHG